MQVGVVEQALRTTLCSCSASYILGGACSVLTQSACEPGRGTTEEGGGSGVGPEGALALSKLVLDLKGRHDK